MRMLIVEDEKDLCNILKKRLQKDYTIDICMDGEIAKDYLNTYTYDIILLDIMLPKIDGITLLKWLRNQKKTTPVLLLTAKSSIEERVNGLDSGADDYMTKPFSAAELVARINALTRRKGEVIVHELKYEDLSLQLDTCELYCQSQHIHLGYKEFEIMKHLMSHPEMITSKDDLIISVWGSESDAMDNNVEVYISFLRKKLKFLKSQVSIKVIRKVGYRLEVCDA